jgi:hypothetical protein
MCCARRFRTGNENQVQILGRPEAAGLPLIGSSNRARLEVGSHVGESHAPPRKIKMTSVWKWLYRRIITNSQLYPVSKISKASTRLENTLTLFSSASFNHERIITHTSSSYLRNNFSSIIYIDSPYHPYIFLDIYPSLINLSRLQCVGIYHEKV